MAQFPLPISTKSQKFGYRPAFPQDPYHKGMDFSFSGITGAAVACAAGGTVTAVGHSSSINWWKEVEHADGWYTRYHMLGSNAGPQKGEFVGQGATIGFVGPKYGVSTGPHLHFEVRNHRFNSPTYGTAVDPESNINNIVGATIETPTPTKEKNMARILNLGATKDGIHRDGSIFFDGPKGIVGIRNLGDLGLLRRYIEDAPDALMFIGEIDVINTYLK